MSESKAEDYKRKWALWMQAQSDVLFRRKRKLCADMEADAAEEKLHEAIAIADAREKEYLDSVGESYAAMMVENDAQMEAQAERVTIHGDCTLEDTVVSPRGEEATDE